MKDAIITIVIVAVLLGGGFWGYRYFYAPGVIISPAPAAGGPTLELVDRLRSVEIDTSFFADPAFLELQAPPPLVVESFPKGRSNPFAPIEE